MQRRLSLTDHVLVLAAQVHARSVYRRFLAATKRATALQEKVLLAKVRRNADSQFGRDYRFDCIASAADFIRHVPILRYEDHRPYVERVKAGDLRALFGPRERLHMFALTSGTTDEPKYIPVTGSFLAEYRRGWNAFGIKALLDHPSAMLRGILQVVSRMDESRTPAGIPCGAITGLMAATQKRLVRRYYVTPSCIAEIDDPTAKYYTIMRLAVPSDVGFLITASPATQLKIAHTADAHREQLIRDVHNGTLSKDLPVPAQVREQLRPRLQASPGEARRLEALVTEHGRLLPRHYWQLGFLANWTGGTMGLYLHDFPEYFGEVPVRDIGLLASEGRLSLPIEDGTPAGILEVTSHFFEFVPRDRIQEESPPTMRSHQLDLGQEYFVLLTTSSGLYRYDLGDLVRVVGYHHQAPVIEFLNKGAHVCSLAGEKLTEHQVILAMEKAAPRLGAHLVSFVLAPQWGRPPHYVLHLDTGDGLEQALLVTLADELEKQLQALNVEYASKRRTDRLGPVRLNLLPAGCLTQLDRRLASRHRQGNEQYKHQYLYPDPATAADFPTEVGPNPHPGGPAPSDSAKTTLRPLDSPPPAS